MKGNIKYKLIIKYIINNSNHKFIFETVPDY